MTLSTKIGPKSYIKLFAIIACGTHFKSEWRRNGLT